MFETNGYDHSHMLYNCKRKSKKYAQQSNLGDQLAMFADIYNFDVKQKTKRLYFQDYMRDKGSNVRSYEWTGFTIDQQDVRTI